MRGGRSSTEDENDKEEVKEKTQGQRQGEG